MEGVGLSTFFRRWLPLIVWIVVIFGLSSIPDVVEDRPELPTGIDKFAHFFEYAILAFVLHRGLRYGRKRSGPLLIFAIIACGLAVGFLDELYQTAIPGREASTGDIVADIAGVIAGTALALIVEKRKLLKDYR